MDFERRFRSRVRGTGRGGHGSVVDVSKIKAWTPRASVWSCAGVRAKTSRVREEGGGRRGIPNPQGLS